MADENSTFEMSLEYPLGGDDPSQIIAPPDKPVTPLVEHVIEATKRLAEQYRP